MSLTGDHYSGDRPTVDPDDYGVCDACGEGGDAITLQRCAGCADAICPECQHRGSGALLCPTCDTSDGPEPDYDAGYESANYRAEMIDAGRGRFLR